MLHLPNTPIARGRFGTAVGISGGKKSEQSTAPDNPENDPEDWGTGDETMTGPQRSYLETLCREAGEEFDPTLSKAEASKRIEELQQKTGRGRDH